MASSGTCARLYRADKASDELFLTPRGCPWLSLRFRVYGLEFTVWSLEGVINFKDRYNWWHWCDEGHEKSESGKSGIQNVRSATVWHANDT